MTSWNSGVYLPADTQAAYNAFGTWRGTPVSYATVFAPRSVWSDIVSPTWLYNIWESWPGTVVFTEAMIPSSVPGVTMANLAAGDYNSEWVQFGTNIVAAGLGDSIIRLGWEFNGNWYPWAATDPVQFNQAWIQIVNSVRQTAPDLKWCWNVNRGVSSGLSDPTLAYPGDAYVDIVGVDSYDWYPPATSAANWNTQLNGTQGLLYWLLFAKSHSKRFSVPEWGNVNQGNPNDGADNPAYVNDMAAFFLAHNVILEWESNFQGPSTGGVYQGATTVPLSAAAYQAAF